jgi:hypothetical protein
MASVAGSPHPGRTSADGSRVDGNAAKICRSSRSSTSKQSRADPSFSEGLVGGSSDAAFESRLRLDERLGRRSLMPPPKDEGAGCDQDHPYSKSS